MLLLLAALAACGGAGESDADASPEGPPMTSDHPDLIPLARLVATHADELMAIPGVEGLAVGLLDDGRTPCLQVLVVERTPELVARLPEHLEGHPVVVVESGGLRPLDGD